MRAASSNMILTAELVAVALVPNNFQKRFPDAETAFVFVRSARTAASPKQLMISMTSVSS
jgi:hypothetical protein